MNVVTGKKLDLKSNDTKSPILSGNKAVSPLCLSSLDCNTSNNTNNLMNKLGVVDLSEDGKDNL